MNMDFPHPRNGLTLQSRRSNFAALVAQLSARQANSQTARSMIAPVAATGATIAPVEGRIMYFAHCRKLPAHSIYGSFFPENFTSHLNPESAVNPDGSINRKSQPLDRFLPDDGQDMRGMEV